jgi:hypothetical protein
VLRQCRRTDGDGHGGSRDGRPAAIGDGLGHLCPCCFGG